MRSDGSCREPGWGEALHIPLGMLTCCPRSLVRGGLWGTCKSFPISIPRKRINFAYLPCTWASIPDPPQSGRVRHIVNSFLFFAVLWPVWKEEAGQAYHIPSFFTWGFKGVRCDLREKRSSKLSFDFYTDLDRLIQDRIYTSPCFFFFFIWMPKTKLPHI